MRPAQVIEADRTWIDGRFLPDVQVAVDPNGRITDTGALGLTPTRRFPSRLLIPGMVNVHSHAFQRGLRGRGETFRDGAGDFWSWRNAMYDLVTALDADTLYRTCRMAFHEMLNAGITCVGEFHYLHHDAPDDFAFDRVMLRAARDAGIRLVLLETFYATGGIGKPLQPGQQRFRTPSVDEFWRHLDMLADELDPANQTLGVAAHSIRAVSLEALRPLRDEARTRSWPFHMHLEEQRREIAECARVYGRRPIELVLDTLGEAHGVTAVHCTHTPPDVLTRFQQAGGGVCLCPLTEGNLGDGIPTLTGAPPTDTLLCLGTDSNARISMLEEMRWLEYGQRWRTETRGVLQDAQGATAPRLFAAATEAGARVLHVEAGRIAPGAWADLVVVNPTTVALDGLPPEDLMAGLVFGSGEDAIDEVCVGGRWVGRES